MFAVRPKYALFALIYRYLFCANKMRHTHTNTFLCFLCNPGGMLTRRLNRTIHSRKSNTIDEGIGSALARNQPRRSMPGNMKCTQARPSLLRMPLMLVLSVGAALPLPHKMVPKAAGTII